MLYSQGFRTAERLAAKTVPFFQLCGEQLSVQVCPMLPPAYQAHLLSLIAYVLRAQAHYDFGLRALKAVLVSAGNIKRDRIQAAKDSQPGLSAADAAEQLNEQEVLIQSICETMVPKLVAGDIALLHSLLGDVFPGVPYHPAPLDALRQAVSAVCEADHLVPNATWVEKIVQLWQIQGIHHGVMLVGPTGSGKSSAWRTLLKALERLDQCDGVSYVIDPKAISKDELYGTLDPTTREWSDGLFTHILRKVWLSWLGDVMLRGCDWLMSQTR
jgi:dynein heavy chain 1